jgi:hypothetical protein
MPRLLKLRELEPLLRPPKALPPPDLEPLLEPPKLLLSRDGEGLFGRAVGEGDAGRAVGLGEVVGRVPTVPVEGDGRVPVLGCVVGRAAEEEP